MIFQAIDSQSLDRAEWEKLVRTGSIFQTCLWAEISAAALGSKAKPIFLGGYEQGQLIAGLPAIISRRFGLSSFFSMAYGDYGGALFEDGIEEGSRQEFFASLNGFFLERNFSRVIIVDFLGSMRGWLNPRFARSCSFTHIINRRETGECYLPDKKTERHLRAAQKAGIEIVRVRDDSQVEQFYHLYRLTEKRHGRNRPIYSRHFFDTLIEKMGRSESLYWTAAVIEGKMIASQMNFIYGDSLVFWKGASDYEMRHYKAGYVLMDDAIRKARDVGATKVNLGASPPEAAGLIAYKEGWGGRKTEYEIYLYRSRLFRLLGR